MTQYVYCIKDKLARQCGMPFVQVNDDCAVRFFRAQVERTPLYASDWELWRCGTFDVVTGEIVPDLVCLGQYDTAVPAADIEEVN